METYQNTSAKADRVKNIVIVIACAAIAGLGFLSYDQYKKNQDLKQNVVTLEGYNSEAVTGFSTIERNLMDIRQREGSIVNDLNEEGVGTNSEQRIENEIKAIEKLIAENKEVVKQLKLNLGDKDKEIGKYSASIQKLEGRIKNYREDADKLQASLLYANAKGDSLSNVVSERDFDLNVKTLVIDQQTDHINTISSAITKMDAEKREAFYVVGTFDELKTKNVIEKQGGVLGIGSTKALKENFDRGQFQKIDKLDFETIPVFAKNAEIISNHDRDSYELVLSEDEKVEYIKILDPDKFWENTRYLIVLTKGAA